MPRSAEAKLRRRNRKQSDNDEAMNLLGDTSTGEDKWEDDDDNNDNGANADDDPIEMFPTATTGSTKKKALVDDNFIDNLPKKKSSKKKISSNPAAKGEAVAGTVAGGGATTTKSGIKTTPLILLILMVGTTLLPALIFAGDYLGKIMSKNHYLGSVGYQLGIGNVPKQRIISFYEKHSPEKINDIPTILSKHYGNYPQLIKKLERKYHDYGYFIDWENDANSVMSIKVLQEQLNDVYTIWITQYWNVYAPQIIKTSFRNIKYNLLTIKKKSYKIWKKHLWPTLEPIFGTPGNAAEQKRKDKLAAQKLQRQREQATTKTKTRRRSHEFRDDVDE